MRYIIKLSRADIEPSYRVWKKYFWFVGPFVWECVDHATIEEAEKAIDNYKAADKRVKEYNKRSRT